MTDELKPSPEAVRVWNEAFFTVIESDGDHEAAALVIDRALRPATMPGDQCANCHGIIGELASGRDPEELCDTCYEDSQAARSGEAGRDDIRDLDPRSGEAHGRHHSQSWEALCAVVEGGLSERYPDEALWTVELPASHWRALATVHTGEAGWQDTMSGDVVEAHQFTLTDPHRLLRKKDVEGVCASPDMCFEYSETARCWPCAVKASKVRGVQVNESLPKSPEVARLNRTLTAMQPAIQAAVDALERIATVDMGGGFLGAQACRKVAASALATLRTVTEQGEG